MTAADLNARDLIASLRSRRCPLCGARKGAGKTVCFACWRGVPRRLQARLYNGVGDGYVQAVADLFTACDVSTASLPRRLGLAPAACPDCGGLGVVFAPGGHESTCPACGGSQ